MILENLSDNFSILIAPGIATLLLISSFYKDYKDKSYRMMIFLNKGFMNRSVVYRFLGYLSIIVVLQYISILLKYRLVIKDINDVGHLLLRFIPPLIFLVTLSILILVISKSIPFALVIPNSYLMMDIFTEGLILKRFAIYDMGYVMMNTDIYYKNKITLLVTSLLFI